MADHFLLCLVYKKPYFYPQQSTTSSAITTNFKLGRSVSLKMFPTNNSGWALRFNTPQRVTYLRSNADHRPPQTRTILRRPEQNRGTSLSTNTRQPANGHPSAASFQFAAMVPSHQYHAATNSRNLVVSHHPQTALRTQNTFRPLAILRRPAQNDPVMNVAARPMALPTRPAFNLEQESLAPFMAGINWINMVMRMKTTMNPDIRCLPNNASTSQ